MPHDLEHESERMTRAYDAMLARIHDHLRQSGGGPEHIREAITEAREQSVRNNELSPSEAERVSHWIRRDLRDAGDYLTQPDTDLRGWLHMDLELLEHSLLDLISMAADHTKLELLQFEEQAQHVGEYHTGEVSGPGTLECIQCGELLRFQHTGTIPPCPRCRETVFKRKRLS